MKIIQLNTYDIDGGAARAGYRLHRGLIEIGQQSRLLAIVKSSQDETVSLVCPQSQVVARDSDYFSLIQRHYINANRTPLSNTLFSLPYPGLDLTQLPAILAADIINLHWIAYYQSPVTIKKLLDLGKPVVWTLHDMAAFTGGCHYSSGCLQYQKDCTSCPQLENDTFNLTSALLKDKIELFANSNLTIVTPSHWLAESARNSQLFRHHRIEVIPYSLETDIFVPLAKTEAKKRLGISHDTFTLLVGAQDGNERRKGFLELLQSLKICSQNVSFQELVEAKQFRILCFGIPNQQLQELALPLLSLGNINSDDKISEIYSAADIFVLPSLEDNLPNTMLEAMSCGTPVIAFNIGGVSDILQDGITGRLLSEVNSYQMAQAILDAIERRDLYQQMAQQCRQVMATYYALPVQARRYIDLYQELLLAHPPSPKRTTINVNAAFNTSSLSVPVNVSRGASFDRIFGQISLKVAEVELVNLRTQLEQTQGELKQSQEQVQQAQTELANLSTQLKQNQVELKQTKVELKQNQVELKQTKVELKQTKLTLKRSQITIKDMETSKFWQVRLAWIRVKRALGLAKDEPP